MDNGEQAQELYEKILTAANMFLRNAKLFEMRALQDHDPSYVELAKIMTQLAGIITTLIDDEDPLLAQKATDYVTLMMKMSLAIRNGDDIGLKSLTAELDKKPFI